MCVRDDVPFDTAVESFLSVRARSKQWIVLADVARWLGYEGDGDTAVADAYLDDCDADPGGVERRLDEKLKETADEDEIERKGNEMLNGTDLPREDARMHAADELVKAVIVATFGGYILPGSVSRACDEYLRVHPRRAELSEAAIRWAHEMDEPEILSHGMPIHPDAQDAAARMWVIAWCAGLLTVVSIVCLIWAVL